MSREVLLPQLGESVSEGVITAWLVAVGDEVSLDQALVEISTDKVDTEVPAPVAGTVLELRSQIEDTVEVGQVIAVIDDGSGESDASDDTAAGASAGQDTAAPDPAATSATPCQTPSPAPKSSPGPSGPSRSRRTDGARVSPVVKRILREAGLDASEVTGTGDGGRITREDAERAAASPAPTPEAAPTPPPAATPAPPAPAPAAPSARPAPPAAGACDRTEPLTRTRKLIAAAMQRSLRESAQLTAAVEVDMSAVMALRAEVKEAFQATHGVPLTPLPFVARAVCMTLPRHPALNATIDVEAGTATYRRDINLGIAVDTERGLLVPNVRGSQDIDLAGLATRIRDLADRARTGRDLSPDDLRGGSFTITNTGSGGTLFDTPILNPPEVGILATCAIEKRPVVVSDALGDTIAIRWMSYFCLTYDHRLVDGADAARFLKDLTWTLQNHDFRGALRLA